VEWESGVLEHKSGNIPKHVKIEEKLLWGPIVSHQRSFEWYHPWPPTTTSSPD